MTDIETLAAHPTLGLDKGRAYVIDGEAGGPYVIDGTRTRVRVASTTGAGAPVQYVPEPNIPAGTPAGPGTAKEALVLGVTPLAGWNGNGLGLYQAQAGTEFSGAPFNLYYVDNIATHVRIWSAPRALTLASIAIDAYGPIMPDGDGTHYVADSDAAGRLVVKLYKNGALARTQTWQPGELLVKDLLDGAPLDVSAGDALTLSFTLTSASGSSLAGVWGILYGIQWS